ncbi:MAG: hypothetical protein JKY65_08710 [Planctomycetes bacterium]|nr:hypothetical protein [Planctomycetota bacterium]
MSQQAADRSLLAGAGCLVVALVVGLAVALAGFGFGLSAFFQAQSSALKEAEQAPAFLSTLEGAVAWCGIGSLGLLIAFGSLVILLRELAEESARRRRGEIRA